MILQNLLSWFVAVMLRRHQPKLGIFGANSLSLVHRRQSKSDFLVNLLRDAAVKNKNSWNQVITTFSWRARHPPRAVLRSLVNFSRQIAAWRLRKKQKLLFMALKYKQGICDARNLLIFLHLPRGYIQLFFSCIRIWCLKNMMVLEFVQRRRR